MCSSRVMETQFLSEIESNFSGGPKSTTVHQHFFFMPCCLADFSTVLQISFCHSFIYSWFRSFIPCVCWRRRRSVVAPAAWQRRPTTSCWGRWRCWRWRIPTCDRSCRTTPTTWPSWRRRRPTWRLVPTPRTPPSSHRVYWLIETKQPIDNCEDIGPVSFLGKWETQCFCFEFINNLRKNYWVQLLSATKNCIQYIWLSVMQNWRAVCQNGTCNSWH